METQISPPFDSYINKLTVHACVYGCQQLISLLLLRLLSRVCQTSTGARRSVFNWLWWLSLKSHLHGCNSPHDCLVMLSGDLATFCAIYSTNMPIWKCEYLTCVSPPLPWLPHCRGSPPPPTNHPYI